MALSVSITEVTVPVSNDEHNVIILEGELILPPHALRLRREAVSQRAVVIGPEARVLPPTPDVHPIGLPLHDRRHIQRGPPSASWPGARGTRVEERPQNAARRSFLGPRVGRMLYLQSDGPENPTEFDDAKPLICMRSDRAVWWEYARRGKAEQISRWAATA